MIKKWEERNKDLIERKQKQAKALEGLDDLTKQNLIQKMNIIGGAADFIGSETSSQKKRYRTRHS